ncbi:MAG: putative lipoprotein, partial [Phycisphaerales bacterium]|nr:putative lipoprotein [Phycisphaerales bacterium]
IAVAVRQGGAVPGQPMPLDGRQEVMLGFAAEAADLGQHFFYVLIRGPVGPAERGEKYEDPLADALGDLGEVTGGGSQLGDGDAIEYCGLDVVVNDCGRGLSVIRACLRSCHAPADTVIAEYLPAFRELPL